jgi:hypothetical protein
MCVYVGMYVCMCVYVCTCVCTCMCVCLYVCMHACMYVCMCVYVCVYACMYVCMYACMYVCMYVFMYVRTYVCKLTSTLPVRIQPLPIKCTILKVYCLLYDTRPLKEIKSSFVCSKLDSQPKRLETGYFIHSNNTD